MCGQTYGPEYADTFCTCGFELVAAAGAPKAAEPSAPALVLYGANRQVLQRFPLTGDVTVIGRQDPVEAIFPEIDLAAHLEPLLARRVSREHIAIIHSRQDNRYTLRPLPGNTGTQLEADMVQAGQEYPLHPGHRIILGGAVRLKFDLG